MEDKERETEDALLRERLRLDLGGSEAVEPLMPVVRRLAHWRAPKPSSADTAHLMAALLPALPSHDAFNPARFALLLLRAQLRVVRREIWAASLMVMALGGLVTLLPHGAPAGQMLPFALAAPIVAAVGVAFVYGPFVDPALEIELATRATPRLVLLARLALVFGFDLALGLTASAVLSLLSDGVSFWPLVQAWLAPMAFLSTLALLLGVLSADPTLGTLVSLGLWFLQVLRQSPSFSIWLSNYPDWLATETQAWLWLLAALCAGLALWIGGREEHWIGRAA